jgi:hypothetical protein
LATYLFRLPATPGLDRLWRLFRCAVGQSWSGATPEGARTHAIPSSVSVFDALQDVLRLASQCPSGAVGDDIRRAACDLIEANTAAQSSASRQRLLRAITRVDSRRLRGRGRDGDPSGPITTRLGELLRATMWEQYPAPPDR